ncbi:MAG TPA: hypothetical protein VIU33_00555 [Nitrospiria bacterium]
MAPVGVNMSEIESGRKIFNDIVKEIDSGVSVVIPEAPSNGLFLISLTKGNARKFMTVSEDDIVDLTSDDLIKDEVRDRILGTISELKS